MTDWYVARVNPVPWTVPNVSIRRGKGGGYYPQFYSAEALKDYKNALAEEIKNNYEVSPTDKPVGLEFYFFRQLEQVKKKGGVVTGAFADATNLQKATEDALQGVLFDNDSQVHSVHSWIMEQDMDTKPGVAIFMWEYPVPPVLPEEVRTELAKEVFFGGDPSDNEVDIDVEDIF